MAAFSVVSPFCSSLIGDFPCRMQLGFGHDEDMRDKNAEESRACYIGRRFVCVLISTAAFSVLSLFYQ